MSPTEEEKLQKAIGASVTAALQAFDAREEARKKTAAEAAEAQKVLEVEIRKTVTVELEEGIKVSVRKELETEFEEEKKAWAKAKGTFSIKKLTELGADNEGLKVFDHYLRTGDRVAAKAALQEDTAGEGGYLVPDDFNAAIISKRDPVSFPRKMGVQLVTTSRDKIDMPTEDTSFTKFVRTAEEGAVDENEPTFAQNQVTVHKWTKLVKISNELLDDEACDLGGWMTGAVARAAALTEAYYVAIGSGTNQHEGIFTGGDTDALSFDTHATFITPPEIAELLYILGEGYHDGAAWLMDGQTERRILTLTQSNEWAFGAADSMYYDQAQGLWLLYGKPIYKQGDIPEYTNATCFIAVGHPWYYALVERTGMSVRRLDELYAGNDQVGFLWKMRQGGKVLVETSWVCGVANT